jgi:hypothetical protein
MGYFHIFSKGRIQAAPLQDAGSFKGFLQGESTGGKERAGSGGNQGQARAATGWLGLGRSEQAGNFAEFGAGVGDGRGDVIQSLTGGGLDGACYKERQTGLRIALGDRLRSMVAMALLENLPSASQRVALVADEALDLQGQLDVMAAIKPLAGSTLVGFELGKLRLPKTQDIRLDATNAGHIANLEVEAVGDDRRVKVAILGKLHGHGEDEEDTATRAGILL